MDATISPAMPLQAIREQHGLTRWRVALDLGVTESTVRRWERGWMPPVHRLRQLGALYGLTLDQAAAAIEASTRPAETPYANGAGGRTIRA